MKVRPTLALELSDSQVLKFCSPESYNLHKFRTNGVTLNILFPPVEVFSHSTQFVSLTVR